MSYSLKLNDAEVIKHKDKTLNSFWMAYDFLLEPGATPQDAKITIGNGYFAIYCSHDSSIKISEFGSKSHSLIKTDALNNVEIVTSDEKKIKLSNLEYKGMQDIEAANQAMQLHLFRFMEPDGIDDKQQWINDGDWQSGFELEGKGRKPWRAADHNPFWERTCKWPGGERYCHSSIRRKYPGTPNGVQRVIAFSMPYIARSLFSFWISKNDETQFPQIDIEAKGRDVKDAERPHWKESIRPADIPRGNNSEGISMIVQGAFAAISIQDLLDDVWRDALKNNDEEKLWSLLMNIVTVATTHITIKELADRNTNSVVKLDASALEQEFFRVKFTI